MRSSMIFLATLLLSASCSAVGSDSWTDEATLSAVETALGEATISSLAGTDDPLTISDRPEDRKITPVRVDDGDPVLGAADASVTIVVFSDYQCPFCSRHEETVAKIKETYGDQVRVVFKQFPLAFHKQARPAAIAALAAGAQDRFWEMHYRIFANARSLSRDNFFVWAKELGLDMGDFETALASEEIATQVARDIAAGSEYGVRGTPATFVNGVFLSGAQPYSKVDALVILGLKRAWVLLKNGVPADEVYDTLITLQPAPGGTQGKSGNSRPGYLHKDWK